jgi:hypothetical protein
MQVRSVAISLIIAHILSLLGFSTYAVALTQLQDQWGLTNSEAGWIASGFFIGYVVTVSTWNSLTDVMDARRIYTIGSLLAASGGIGFAFGAEGFVSALLFQTVLGAGIAENVVMVIGDEGAAVLPLRVGDAAAVADGDPAALADRLADALERFAEPGDHTAGLGLGRAAGDIVVGEGDIEGVLARDEILGKKVAPGGGIWIVVTAEIFVPIFVP